MAEIWWRANFTFNDRVGIKKLYVSKVTGKTIQFSHEVDGPAESCRIESNLYFCSKDKGKVIKKAEDHLKEALSILEKKKRNINECLDYIKSM